MAELDARLEHRMDARPTAAHLLLARLLALPAADLGAAVADAVEQNPALELTDRPRCAGCGRLLQGRACRWCSPGIAAPLDRAAPDDPRDALKRDLHLVLPSTEHPLAERVVDELDDRGLLGRSARALAAELGVPPVRLEAVLDGLRQVAPAGVGAPDARSSLLAQLDAWHGEPAPPDTRVVLEHAATLLDGGPSELACQLDLPVEAVTKALAFVATHLSPTPIDLSAAAPCAGASVDLIVVEAHDGSLAVEIADPGAYGLRLAHTVCDAARDRSAPADARAWASARVHAARLFISQLHRRCGAVLIVAQAAVDHQAAFVRRGPHAHRRLTRAELARTVGLHESTVSRAVADKRVRLPDGTVVALDVFFGTGVAARAVLRELLAEQSMRSDATLALELARRGHPVARRTVAKYRAALARPR